MDFRYRYIRRILKYLLALAKEQIKLAFEQAEKEVQDLRQRTREGIETARLNGKQIGQEQGAKLVTKKSIQAKEQIKKYSKDFQGSLSDVDVMKLIGIARNSYYKYKKELKEELVKEYEEQYEPVTVVEPLSKNKEKAIKRAEELELTLGSYDKELEKVSSSEFQRVLDNMKYQEDTDVMIKGKLHVVEIDIVDNEIDLNMLTQEEYIERYGDSRWDDEE